MKPHFLFLSLIVLFTSAIHAQIVVLDGAVSKYPIMMAIDTSDHAVLQGVYFYKNKKQDIELTGSVSKSGSFELSSDDTGDKFSMTKKGSVLQGTFTSAKGVKLQVTLNVIKDSLSRLEVTKRSDAAEILDAYKFADIKLVPGRLETIDNRFTIQWYTEPLSKISMFKIAKGYPDEVIRKANAIIEKNFNGQLSAYFSCTGYEKGSGYDFSISSYFLTDRFISYCISANWDCKGAAHPDFGESGTTIDARNGRELSLEDIFWLGKGAKPQQDSKEWFEYRDKVFAPKIVALFKGLYPKEMKKPTSDEDCDYTDPEVWNFPEFYFTKKGLQLGAFFARYIRKCDNPSWSIIPYSELFK